MRHGLALYQSDKAKFSDKPTPIFWLNALLIVLAPISFFLFSVPLLPILAVVAVHSGLWVTNQQWGMDEKEIDFWHKYKSLPKNYRKTLDLTPKYVRELDGRAWEQAKSKVENIYNLRMNSLHENDLPAGLAAKFAAIEQSERDFAEHRRSVEKELSSRNWS